MNGLILGYVRITWYAVLFCMRMLIGMNLCGEQREKAQEYCDNLQKAGEELEKIADDEYEL